MRLITAVASVAAALMALVAAAVALERAERVDESARRIAWGGGEHQTLLHRPGRVIDDMVFIPGGDYLIGDDEGRRDAPRRVVHIEPFQIDRHEVTNREFAQFVEATNYVTTAERQGEAWIYRGGSDNWQLVRGADWRHPLGPSSSIRSADDHPVVLVSWHDALAYARWRGKRLPTEVEWEVAARAGAPHSAMNIWEGTWPQRNRIADGFFYTAPVGSFRPSGRGLYDMLGNVWEWTDDWYDSAKALKTARGGSWFCSENYCRAYRPGFRGKSPPDRAFNNLGFRCAADVPPRGNRTR